MTRVRRECIIVLLNDERKHNMSALSPVEVYEARLKFIPNFIIDVINKILIKRCKSPTGAIEILDYELHAEFYKEMQSLKLLDNSVKTQEDAVKQLYRNGWMQFELNFQQAGWDVVRKQCEKSVKWTFNPQPTSKN